jgi:hypothetical protein
MLAMPINTSKKVKERSTRLLEYFVRYGCMTLGAAALLLGVSDSMAQWTLKHLLKKGVIIRKPVAWRKCKNPAVLSLADDVSRPVYLYCLSEYASKPPSQIAVMACNKLAVIRTNLVISRVCALADSHPGLTSISTTEIMDMFAEGCYPSVYGMVVNYLVKWLFTDAIAGEIIRRKSGGLPIHKILFDRARLRKVCRERPWARP